MRKPVRLTCLLLTCLVSGAFAGTATDERIPRSAAQPKRAEAPIDQIIVKFRTNESIASATPSRSQIVQNVSVQVGVDLSYVRNMGTGATVMALPSSVSAAEAEAISQKIRALPSVEYAEPDLWAYPKATPNDPQFVNQWHLTDPIGGINAPAAWDISTGVVSTVVAVIDTGYTAHPDLDAKWLSGYDFITNATMAGDGGGRDPDATDAGDWVSDADKTAIGSSSCTTTTSSSWHGTSVAGVIGASTNNALNASGIDWAARILPVRVLGKCGGRSSDITDGILWAAGIAVPGIPANPTPAKILNLSLGSLGSCPNTYQDAITQANASGKIVVVAAGNDNTSDDDSLGSCSGVINVAATARNGSRASYSNYGPTITLAAPGGDSGDLVTLGNTGTQSIGSPTVVTTSGTSFSAPVVSGVLSLMAALKPNLDIQTAKQLLAASARPFPDATCTTATCGYGIIDAAAALRLTRDQSIGVATFVGFGDVTLGQPNADLVLKVSNLAAIPQQITSASISAGGAEFSITGNTCANQLVANGATCNINLRFNPAAKDLRSGELTLTASDARTYRVSLAGYGYAPIGITQRSSGASTPLYLAKGPDGNYWYTQSLTTGNRVVRMTPSGQISEYSVPTSSATPFDITAGADGNMWFTEQNADKIGRILPTGEITEFSLPASASARQPRAIVSGPDGNLWFTEILSGSIGRITPQGTITEFSLSAGSSPRGLTVGPDGNFWFTDAGNISVGKMTPAGTVTRYTLPWTSSGLRAITKGPDGNLWFVELDGNRIGRITPAGVATQFPLPRGGTNPLYITAGPDGGMWFAGNSGSRVGRIDTATGTINEYRLPSPRSSPAGIAIGPNNTLWIANSGNTVSSIASLSIPGVSGAAVYSDLWWGGTAENGWGMTIQQHGNTQFNVFFVYDATGKPIWYAMPGGSWNADYTVFSGGLAKPTSAPLNNYTPAQFAAGVQVGTMAITFTSDSTATLNYTINGVPGQKTIQRQQFGPTDNTPGLQVGDMWWGGDAQNGWGVSITQQARTLFAAWYTYDAAGNVTWYTLPGGAWNGKVYSGTLATATSSPWLGQAYNPAQFTPAAAGTVSFNFSDANNAVMSYTFTSGPFSGTTQTKAITRQPY